MPQAFAMEIAKASSSALAPCGALALEVMKRHVHLWNDSLQGARNYSNSGHMLFAHAVDLA
jgi:hypothetical protein